MTDRRLIPAIPIWVRVSSFLALLLVGTVGGSMVLGGSSSGGHEGGPDRGDQTQGMEMQGMDHGAGQESPPAPCESEPTETPVPSGHRTPVGEDGSPDGTEDPTPGPSGSDQHGRSDGARGH